MSFIISLHEPISFLKSALDDFNRKNKRFSIELSRKQIRDLLICLIDDTLTEGLKYAKRSHSFDNKLREYVPWYDDNNDAELAHVEAFEENFMQYVDDQLLPYHDQLQSGPWEVRVVNMLTKNGDDLVISSLGDYRILDWHRRTSSGEWSKK